MDHRRLRMFLAVVEHGSFTAAAAAERIAQPAVSVAVRELETEVGAPLLVRTRHGALVTAAGEALVGPARQALRDLDHAAAAVAAVTGLVAGRLDLTTLPTLAADPVAALVGRFRSSHPGVTVRLGAPNDVEALLTEIRSGTAEIGFTEASPVERGVVQRTIQEQELLAVSPPGTAGQRLRLVRVPGLPLVLTPPGSSMRDVLAAALGEQGVQPTVAVETAQREALIPLVLAGAGTTFLPSSLATAAARLGAVVRPTSPRLRRTVVLVHRSDPLGPAAARFVALSGAGAAR